MASIRFRRRRSRRSCSSSKASASGTPPSPLSRVLRHSDVDRSTFPAARHGEGCTAFRRKLDPGDAFPWEAFRAAVGDEFRAPRP